MRQHSTVLRTANPTSDEGRVFARYLDTAAEGFFRFMLGHRAEDILATAFIQPDHDLSFQNITFAECDKVIVGMVSGYTADQHRRSSGRPLKRAAGRWNLRLIVVSILFAPLLRIIDTIGDDEHRVAVAKAIGHTGIEVRSNDERALKGVLKTGDGSR